LYFGSAPIVVLSMPVHLLTQLYFSDGLPSLLYAVLGYWVAVAWVLEIRRRIAVQLPRCLWWSLIASVGLCSSLLPTLRRGLFYEEAACSAYFWSMVALWSLTKAVLRPRQDLRWLLLGGTATALAAASRATLMPCLVLLPCLAAWCSSRRWKKSENIARRIADPWLAAGTVSFVITAGVLWFNYARFGSPFDFGFKYQLNANPREIFSLNWVWYNGWHYYFRLPQLYPYFPFVAPPVEYPRPNGYFSYEHAHGQFYAGWLVLLLCAFTAAARKRVKCDLPILVVLGLAGVGS
jgi:hypothetical protein